jgi:hypothetical protein
MIGDGGEAVIKKCIAMAKRGNEVALRLVIERILPAKKCLPFKLQLPEKLDTAADISNAMSFVISELSRGEITPDEALHAASLLEAQRRTIESTNFEARLAAVESRLVEAEQQ